MECELDMQISCPCNQAWKAEMMDGWMDSSKSASGVIPWQILIKTFQI